MRKIHASEIHQLTGVEYPVFVRLTAILEKSLVAKRRGAPFGRPVADMLLFALVKLRGGQAYRTLAVYWRVPPVSLHRYTMRVCRELGMVALTSAVDNSVRWFAVDTTSTRVRSSEAVCYSGDKHHKAYKVQLVVDDAKRILDVSIGYPASIHDKRIWNQEFPRVRLIARRPVLGDKAYAGGMGEEQMLFRPVKRGEKRWKQARETSQAFNRDLSRIRVRVEHVFARLKTFRIIRDQFAPRPVHYGMVVRALAVIHNLTLESLS
jgi:hypothetical protein